MNKKVLDKTYFKILVIVFIMLMAYLSYFKDSNEVNALANCDIEIAEMETMKTRWQGVLTKRYGLIVYYTYLVDGKVYAKHQRVCSDCKPELESGVKFRNFHVAYCKDNPDFSYPLITPRSFHFFKLKFPDTLNWVKDYMTGSESDSTKYDGLSM